MRAPIAIALALVACGTSSDTRVHLAVTQAPTLALDHYQILVGDKAAIAQPLAALDIEVPGELAGSAQTLDVWGLDGGQQIAFGATSVTPIEHQTVTAEVALAAASCGSACDLGDTECGAGGTSSCQLVGSCLAFGPPTACAMGEVCSGGACGAPPSCSHEGSACDDGDPCTTVDTCTSGACSGAPTCTSAPANATPTCATDGTCGFACNTGYQPSGSACVLSAPPPTQMTVFLTSGRFTGDLGGLAGADAICQGAANNVQLTGTFKAWLSGDAASAASRLTHATVPYVMLDGTMIATSWADLTDGSLAHSISVDENGQNHSSYVEVRTNTTKNGALTSNEGGDCGAWTTDDENDSTGAGDNQDKDSSWTDDGYTLCSTPDALFCFQQ